MIVNSCKYKSIVVYDLITYNYKLLPTRCSFSWIYFYRRSTCFRRFLRPSSGAHNCTHNFRYWQPVLLLVATLQRLATLLV